MTSWPPRPIIGWAGAREHGGLQTCLETLSRRSARDTKNQSTPASPSRTGQHPCPLPWRIPIAPASTPTKNSAQTGASTPLTKSSRVVPKRSRIIRSISNWSGRWRLDTDAVSNDQRVSYMYQAHVDTDFAHVTVEDVSLFSTIHRQLALSDHPAECS